MPDDFSAICRSDATAMLLRKRTFTNWDCWGKIMPLSSMRVVYATIDTAPPDAPWSFPPDEQ